MMKFKKILIFICLIICLLSIASVCAGEVNNTIVASENQNDKIISIENQDNDKLSVTENDELLAEPGTFTDLNATINTPGDVITLNKNYTYSADNDSDFKNGIIIDRNITIDGNGYTINGNNQARAFNIATTNVILKNITFINCKADNGGAISWTGANGAIENCIFNNNTATNGGGAINWYKSDYGRIENCSFSENTAFRYGALLWSSSAYGYVVNCSFTANKVTSTNYYNGGGAVYWSSSAYGRLDKCKFSANTAPNCGAVFWYNSADGRIGNCTFSANTAKQDGGVICWVSDRGNIGNCSFMDNSAGRGGVIYVGTGTGNIIYNCTFRNNSAGRDGGVVFGSSGSNNAIVNCSFRDNSAGRGGAIYWNSGNNNNLTNCTFKDNHADEGGAIFWYGGNSIVGNCNFEDNTNGSTIYLNQLSYTIYSFSLINSTEIGNSECDYFIFNDGWNLYLFNNTLICPIYTSGKITSKTNITCLNNDTQVAYNEVVNLDAVIRDDNNNIIIMDLFTFNLNNTKSVKVFFNEEGHANIYYALKDYGQYLINCTDYPNVLTNNTVYAGIIDYRPQEKTTVLINISDVENITFKLADDINTTLKVIVNGVNYDVAVSNGFGNLSLGNITPDVVYSIVAVYTGSEKYESSFNSTSFVVKGSSISISVRKTVYYLDGNTVTVRVLDGNGKAVSGVDVTFKVDGKVILIKTGADGYARLALNLAPGSHTVTAQYDGKVKSSKVVVKSLLSAKKTTAVKKSAKRTSVKITVKGKTTKVRFAYKGKNKISVSFGNTWKNQKVIVRFKGKNYRVKVNAQGKGILKLAKANAKKLKKNKKYSTTVFKSYTGKVKVKFNKKTYKVKINKGVANFKVTKKMVKNLKKGKTVKYTVSYNADKLTRSVKIK